MPNEKELRAEIGHVLFIDIVGYSKLLIDEQSELLERLKEMVRGSEQVQAAQAAGQLIRLATGDGMALVFRHSPEAPAQCALELAQADKEHPELKLRMGIHSGPINEVADVNDRANVTGAGINLAQRVMDCGDAGHILLSKRAADDLAQYRHWQPRLHDLGEVEVKHGVRLGIVSLHGEAFGNSAVPEKLRSALPSGYKFPWQGILILLITLGAVIYGFVFFYQNSPPPVPRPVPPPKASPTPAPSEKSVAVLPVGDPKKEKTSPANGPLVPAKSIAVLPFENLSEEKDNAYFADGVQDEILTNLSRIADLKVISRTSVMQYRSGTARNLREIGKQLGVAHLLEGSVQRSEGKVRVIAQLIDARTDAHLWAEKYDRDLADVFAIQSDIARSIAEQLEAKLAPEVKKRLATNPTTNPEAYLLYLQANEQARIAGSRVDAVAADELYTQAVARDPKFALAIARQSMLNSTMYLVGRLPERKVKARVLANEALRLAPNLSEAHLALGLCYYRIERDYAAALRELAIAQTTSPNDPLILDSQALIYRRQGRWRDALDTFAQARTLDPRRAHFEGVPNTLRVLRQWPAATDAYTAGLKLEQGMRDGWVGLAYVQFARNEPFSVVQATLDHLSETDRKKPDVLEAKWKYAMMARDFQTAERIAPDQPANEFPAVEPKLFFVGCSAFASGDHARAKSLFEQTLPLHEAGLRDHPDDPRFHAPLARLYALLGRKEEALREARRAVELLPESKDAVEGPDYTIALAFVCAQTGNPDEAISLLTGLLAIPVDHITLAHLRLSWEWDPLRADPRFQALLDGPEPETVYH